MRGYATGFTLIEVVVAMAILAVGITVIIELLSGSLRLVRTSGEYTKAVNYARVKMEEITVKPTTNEGIETGEFDGAYRWQVDVRRVDILPARIETEFKAPVELFQVKVHVLWKSGTKERSTVLETYRTIKLEDEEKKS
jgi:general secretion pathway protein I